MKMHKFTNIENFGFGDKVLLRFPDDVWRQATVTDNPFFSHKCFMSTEITYNDEGLNDSGFYNDEPTHYIRLSDIEGLGE